MLNSRRNIIKKITVFIIAAVIIVSGIFTGCGNNEHSNADTSNSVVTTNASENKNSETTSEASNSEETHKISILGEEYVFPMTPQELSDKGWTLLEPDEFDGATDICDVTSKGLTPKMSANSIYFSNGDMKCVRFFFACPADKQMAPFSECKVIGFGIDSDEDHSKKVKQYNYKIYSYKLVTIPDNSVIIDDDIVLGKSTLQEVKTKFGKDSVGDGSFLTIGDTMSSAVYFDENGITNGIIYNVGL